MKKLAVVSSLTLLAALNITPANAEPTPTESSKEGIVGAAKFTTGALIGGAVGGPLGAFVGAVGGSLFAEQGEKNAALKTQFETAQDDLAHLEEKIAMQQVKIADLEEETLARMELQVLFATGTDQVTTLDQRRLEKMADYLTSTPALAVQLDGHADPRGTDEYNNVLSRERAQTIKSILVNRGVDEERIGISFHGASLSSASKGDLDAYTQDRRVDIEITPTNQRVTQADW